MISFLKRIPLSFRVLFFPFIGLLMGLTTAYSFLNWAFIVRPNYFVKNLVVIETYIPILIAGIVVWYWLRPRCERLRVLGVKVYGRPKFGIHKVVGFFLIIIILHCTQVWVESAFAKTVHLSRISEVYSLPKSRFYEVYVDSIDKRLMSTYDHEWKTSGRNVPHYHSQIYMISPVLNEDRASKRQKPIIWLGLMLENETKSVLAKEHTGLSRKGIF